MVATVLRTEHGAELYRRIRTERTAIEALKTLGE
jgi:hypothetical protein